MEPLSKSQFSPRASISTHSVTRTEENDPPPLSLSHSSPPEPPVHSSSVVRPTPAMNGQPLPDPDVLNPDTSMDPLYLYKDLSSSLPTALNTLPTSLPLNDTTTDQEGQPLQSLPLDTEPRVIEEMIHSHGDLKMKDPSLLPPHSTLPPSLLGPMTHPNTTTPSMPSVIDPSMTNPTTQLSSTTTNSTNQNAQRSNSNLISSLVPSDPSSLSKFIMSDCCFSHVFAFLSLLFLGIWL